jgi:molybdenum cofactor cytidylyltransferase
LLVNKKMEESAVDNRASEQVVGIILAAGAGSRFGSDKRQLIGPTGESMLHSVLATYRPCFDTLLVVIPAHDEFGLAACENFSALPIVNANSDEGMGSSLRAAATWLQQQALMRACVIGLADMPLIRSETVCAIRDLVALHNEPVVACTQTQLGFPRALPQQYFSQLAQLHGDVGARAVVEWSSARKFFVEDASVLLDIDTPQDRVRWGR